MTNSQYLADFMKRNSLSEKEFSDIIGCTPGAVHHWLRGIRSVPEILVRLMNFFDDYGLEIRSFHSE